MKYIAQVAMKSVRQVEFEIEPNQFDQVHQIACEAARREYGNADQVYVCDLETTPLALSEQAILSTQAV